MSVLLHSASIRFVISEPHPCLQLKIQIKNEHDEIKAFRG